MAPCCCAPSRITRSKAEKDRYDRQAHRLLPATATIDHQHLYRTRRNWHPLVRTPADTGLSRRAECVCTSSDPIPGPGTGRGGETHQSAYRKGNEWAAAYD